MTCQFESQRARIVRNLLNLYHRQTSRADSESGLAWYPSARAIVGEWSRTYGLEPITIACVIAALSPQCEWSRNLIIADDILASRAVSIGGALHANIRKARAILATRATTTINHLPYGPKVYHFACNLSGDCDAVTVDTHAIQAGLANVLSTVTLRWTPYLIFAECYRKAAHRVHLAPCDFQAVVWHTWKRLHPRVSKIVARAQWPSDDTID